MNLAKSALIILFLTFFFLQSSIVFSQFTYLSINYEFNKVNIGESSVYQTHSKSSAFSVDALYRPIRNLGIGLTASIPVSQNSYFSFAGSEVVIGDGTFGIDFGDGSFNEYEPQEYDYDFTQSFSSSFQVKYFIDTNWNPYLNIQLSYIKFQERFLFKRAYVPEDNVAERDAISAKNIDELYNHHLIYPGIGIGAMPHIADNFFLLAEVNWNFMIFEGPTFEHVISYGDEYPEEGHRYVLLASKLNGLKNNLNLKIGAGFYF